MGIFQRVLDRPEFEEDPPVLVDIGASGGLNPEWNRIARRSICIAFDGEPEGLRSVPQSSTRYKRLCVFNALVTTNGAASADFYLTRSPQCSSLLVPDKEQLSNWAFGGRFEVIEKRKVKTTNLKSILAELGLRKIDWFKSDSQGTDLRLFSTLGESLIRTTLVAEFEPGIIDAYIGEDKLWQVMEFMERQGFWMTDMKVKGSQWLKTDFAGRLSNFHQRMLTELMEPAPGWAEVGYMNRLDMASLPLRDCLLSWLFAMMKRQYGFALHLASASHRRFQEPILAEMEARAGTAIWFSCLRPSAHFHLWRRVAAKLRRRLG